ncbi:MAG TPA: YbaB/EbfC family nucleoid-associated protein [Candidatus Dojkabacteria bacterium]|jgi:DNA-binding protein YbaB
MVNPFTQAKDLWKLQKEAREMQKKMKAIKISGMSDDEKVEVIIDGTQEILELFIDDAMMEVDKKNDLAKGVKQAIKDAQKKLQKEMMKDMDMDKMKSMLGM